MYLNLSEVWEAEPLVGTRIPDPPILRRISGGNDAALPNVIREMVRQMFGGSPGHYPEDHEAKLLNIHRAIAGQPLGGVRAFAGQISQMLHPHNQRTSAGTAGAGSDRFPRTFSSYARH